MNKQESKEVFYAVGGGLLASFLVYSIGRLLVKRQQALQSPIQSTNQQIHQQPPPIVQFPSEEGLLSEIDNLLRILESGTEDELKSISIPNHIDLSTLSPQDRRFLWHRLEYTRDQGYYTGPRLDPYPTNADMGLLIIRDTEGNIRFSPVFYGE